MNADRTIHQLDERGTIRDWLVSPAWSEPADDLAELISPDGSPWRPDGRWSLTNGPDVSPLKERLYARRPLRTDQDWEITTETPAEGGPVHLLGPTGAGHEGRWRRVHTADDGLVDWSEFCFTPEYRLSVAAATVEVDQADNRTLLVACTGPYVVFLDGEVVGVETGFRYMEPAERAFEVWLPSGLSTIRVATWQVAFRECRQVLRVRVGGLPVRVVVPSPGADERRSEIAEQLLEAVGTPRWAVLPTAPGVELTGPAGVALRVRWPGGERRVRLDGGSATVDLRSDTPEAGDQPSNVDESDGEAGLRIASMLSTGEIPLTVMVDDDRAPISREFRVAVLPPAYRGEPVGEPDQWRAELLAHVAAGGRTGSAAELARWTAATESGASYTINADRLKHPLWMIDNRADCADFEAIGLLHLWHRIPAESWPDGLADRVSGALRGFKYWIDQPGLDAMCYFTENHQLVWHVAEMLVGETFEDVRFDTTGLTGGQHAEHGRKLTREWIVRKLAGGFSEFDSNAYLAIDTLALVSIVEFATDRHLAQLAENLLDKLLFTLAVNSWRGIHCSAHGRSYVQTVRSSRLEETAPIMWVCWGTGALNEAVLPATTVATARRYRVPTAIRAAAGHQRDEWIGRQHYRGRYRAHHDLLSRPYESDLLVYRTPDAMLSSVQDYRVGLPGLQEHIWGATIGPETQVYVTHAPNAATSSSARPNAWAGNRILPRVRQYRDTLLALYRLPIDDPMGYTHAWFPLSTMDEWRLIGSWIVGRRGEGYVALATEGGIRVVDTGPAAQAELRAKGPGRAWVCTVGRVAVDGSFDDFVAGLREPAFEPDGVAYERRLGERLRLRWSGPFTVADVPADLTADGVPDEPPHLDNPLCQVGFGNPTMRIDVDGIEQVIALTDGSTGAGRDSA